MNVLAIMGSPRLKGNTDLLVDEALRGAADAGAEVEKLVVDRMNISPCKEYYGCLRDGNCVIRDDMDEIYPRLLDADRLIIASPIFFYGLTGQIKALIDRCQALWARKYVLQQPPLGNSRERKGLFISVGGRRIADLFEPALVMVKTLFRILDVTYAGELLFSGIDEKGAIAKHPDALRQAFLAGQKLVED